MREILYYLDFITPGILVMTMLFASLQGGTLLIFDKILGFLNKFLALPAPRESILFGKILFMTVLFTYLVLFIFGVLFSAIATTLALLVDDYDSYSAMSSMASMPLFFTSSALMPYEVMPEWLRIIASLNPVSYAIDTTRALFTGTFLLTGMIELIVMAIAVLIISVHVFRRATV